MILRSGSRAFRPLPSEPKDEGRRRTITILRTTTIGISAPRKGKGAKPSLGFTLGKRQTPSTPIRRHAISMASRVRFVLNWLSPQGTTSQWQHIISSRPTTALRSGHSSRSCESKTATQWSPALSTPMAKTRAIRHVTPAGNPQTGPFYVVDAQPGDTLVVRLEKISPNRAIGYTGSVVAPNVVEPSYVRELLEGELAEWRIDNESGTATLIKPKTKLGNLTIPLAPMLGCFGVSPRHSQAISTATSAEHGGNMDYRGFVSGVTVYFPVFEPGALLYVGDGHAVQGDGEIVGTGIEISMEVQFTVHVLKGKCIRWPRGENAEYIFTVGNARPLDQAVQLAILLACFTLGVDSGGDHCVAVFDSQIGSNGPIAVW